MRGKVCLTAVLPLDTGITPAYAGKSPVLRSRTVCRGDHPRVCGEKLAFSAISSRELGSPPRMRGKEGDQTAARHPPGITPAYAGKSMYRTTETLCCRDHPRVCGEKFLEGFLHCHCLGSPPRMRGKAGIPEKPVTGCRITPAYAGKRLKRSHRIGHFSCILCLFHSVLHRASASGGSRAGPCAPPCLPAQNAVPV